VLEAMQLILDSLLEGPARARDDPSPFLYVEFALLAIGLEIDRCHNGVADQHRQAK